MDEKESRRKREEKNRDEIIQRLLELLKIKDTFIWMLEKMIVKLKDQDKKGGDDE